MRQTAESLRYWWKGMVPSVVALPTPPHISGLWNFGSLLGLCLTIQIITGVVLAMHYTPSVECAFTSVVHITRDVNYGWCVRAVHANGASFFFLFLYFHVARGIYCGGYRQKGMWVVGVGLLLMLMGVAFMGYVLVWGQMSLWAATVTTNLLFAIPFIGPGLVEGVWGGFAVNDATLHRFYVFHFLLPFVLVVMSFAHLVFLHSRGFGNPLGVGSDSARVPFFPYYVWKDVLSVFMAFWGMGVSCLCLSDLFLELENYLFASPLATPAHTQLEWYFLWVYAILRAVPNKLGGVLVMLGSILVLLSLPVTDRLTSMAGAAHLGTQALFWLWVGNLVLLTWLGSMPVESAFTFGAQNASVFYFLFFFLFPLYSWLGDLSSVRWKLGFHVTIAGSFLLIMRFQLLNYHFAMNRHLGLSLGIGIVILWMLSGFYYISAFVSGAISL